MPVCACPRLKGASHGGHGDTEFLPSGRERPVGTLFKASAQAARLKGTSRRARRGAEAIRLGWISIARPYMRIRRPRPYMGLIIDSMNAISVSDSPYLS